MSTTDSDFHDDDLAELRRGRSRARTASARREAGGSPPPPPPPAPQVSDDATAADRGAADQPRSSTTVTEAPAERAPEAGSATATDTRAAPVDAPDPVDDLSGGESEPAKQAPSGRGKRRARSAPRSAEEPSTQGAFSANVPTSIVGAADADPRPRANLLREAFENHVEAVVEANPAKAPSKLGLEPVREPRASTEGDPFQRILFRFRPHEKDILDEWKNKTSMSRSAFVTELLRLELHG